MNSLKSEAVALKEYKPEKLLYSMGEVTEMFDVKPSLIRFWEQRFDILKPQKNKKGNRLFTPADVKNLEVIYHLTKERGMTLAGVEKYLKNNKKDAERETEIVRRLQTVRSLLVEIREELKEDEEGEIRVFSSTPSVEPPKEVKVEEETEILAFEVPVQVPALEEDRLDPEAGGSTIDISGAGKQCTVRNEIDAFFEQEDEPEEPVDAEVGVPFTAQPLFELEEVSLGGSLETESSQQENPEENKPEEPTAADTQQSLF